MAPLQTDTPRPASMVRWNWVRATMVDEVNRARHMLASGQPQRGPIVWLLYDLAGAARAYSFTEYTDLHTEFHNSASLDDAGLWLLLTNYVERFDTLEPGQSAA